MTEEQIKNILSICNKLDDLKQVKKEISIKEGFDTVTLRYYYDNAYVSSICAGKCMRSISDILKKHNLQIRQEIDNEIERLQNEIKEL